MINTAFLWLAMALNEFEGNQTRTCWSWMQILKLNPALSRSNPSLRVARETLDVRVFVI